MKVEIDHKSGFCFGVIQAIEKAEIYLKKYKHLYSLGDIVHNNEEMKRLINMGLEVISYEQYANLKNTRVLIRAHGEPPGTYRIAQQNNIELIDATCRVVLALQQRIKENNEHNENMQILIFGKKGHAEVIGLMGQTQEKGIVIASEEDIEKIDFNKPTILYSQTTQNEEKYLKIVQKIREKFKGQGNETLFQHHNTICRRVVNRATEIMEFAAKHDKIVFVSGEKSSNGLYLFQLCKESNSHSFFISKIEQIENIPFHPEDNVGICGATSTPMWLMEEVKAYLLKKFHGHED